MKIGISILTHQHQSCWENGIGQNVFYLATLLADLPFVEKVLLIDAGDQGRLPNDAPEFTHRFPIVKPAEAADAIDVAIEMQGGLDIEWLARFRVRGGRVVFHICGQPYAALVEPSMFGATGYFSRPDRCDQVWLLPKDGALAPMVRTLHRCPVHIMPFLWAPSFFDYVARLDAPDAGPLTYEPGMLAGNGGARIAIAEPNLSVLTKTGIIPLLICEQVERDGNCPIEHVYFHNSLGFHEHVTFRSMRDRLQLSAADKISLRGREYLPRILRHEAPLILSHHQGNDANYLYFDVVCGGFPLVHNSAAYRDIGYYYPEFDIAAGAAVLRRAIEDHDRELPAYRAAAEAKIASLSPDNIENQRAYARKLLSLTGGRA